VFAFAAELPFIFSAVFVVPGPPPVGLGLLVAARSVVASRLALNNIA
jgi:hypothetical protein